MRTRGQGPCIWLSPTQFQKDALPWPPPLSPSFTEPVSSGHSRGPCSLAVRVTGPGGCDWDSRLPCARFLGLEPGLTTPEPPCGRLPQTNPAFPPSPQLAPAFPRPGGTLGSASPAGRPGGPSSSWRARRAGPGKASLWTCTLSRHARQRPARKPDTQSQRSLCHRKQVKTQRRPAKQPQTVGLSPGQRGGQPGSGRSTGHPRGLCRECTSRHPASAPRSQEGLRAERAGQGQTPAAGQPPRAQLLVL